MIKAVAKFWGTGRDQSGMPEPYNSYLVISSPWETQECGIASVVPISGSARLSKSQFLADRGGERAAFESAITSLKGELSNAGLRFELQED
jgi:hypothetical protein